MCKILNISYLNDKIILDCSEYNGDFEGAKLLKIKSEGSILETTGFILEKSKSCFSEHHSPWIMLTSPVEDRYLRKGNEIFLQ